MRNADNKLVSLQFIDNNGKKGFLSNGTKSGCYFVIGNPDNYYLIYIAEGYATAATLHECTGVAVVVAFDAGNLLLVAGIFTKRYPKSEIIIAADNDRFKPENQGIVKASKAAEAYSCLVAIPTFAGNQGTDYNDLYILEGQEAVSESLARA